MLRQTVVLLMIWLSVPALHAQELELMTVSDFQTLLAEQDKPLLVNFWATWCKPCVEELPHFVKLAGEHPEDMTLWLVSLDFQEETLRAFLESHEMNVRVIYLTNGLRDPDWIGQIDDSWSGAIPASLALNPSVDIRQFQEGSFTAESLNEWIRPLIESNKE